MKSSLANIYSAKGNDLYLVVTPKGDNFSWHYVLVDAVKKPIFEQRIENAFLELEDYGQVLYSGWGDEPPADIKAKIKEQFG